MVKVRLIEKRVKSHVGRVMVVKVITQYRKLGITWKKKVNIQPNHPAMVEGVGGDVGGGGRGKREWDEAGPERLAVIAGGIKRERTDDEG